MDWVSFLMGALTMFSLGSGWLLKILTEAGDAYDRANEIMRQAEDIIDNQ